LCYNDTARTLTICKGVANIRVGYRSNKEPLIDGRQPSGVRYVQRAIFRVMRKKRAAQKVANIFEHMGSGMYGPLPAAPYNGAVEQTDWMGSFLETAYGFTR
jgi:hypothetical protein